jgi:hypothetical protein
MRRALLTLAFATVQPVLAQTAPPPTHPPAGPCADANHHAFDFWIGKWDVRPYAGGPVTAHSLIESLYGGCAIRENWMPLKGSGGGSLSNYDAADGHWHQTWVDASGTRALFNGSAEGGAIVLVGAWRGSGPKGEDGQTRMTYTREPNGGVRQKGEFSADNGKTWVGTFDLLYTPSGS